MLQNTKDTQVEAENINLIELLDDPRKYFELFQEFYNEGTQFMSLQKYSEAAQNYLQCCEMIEVGVNIFKNQNKYWSLCIYASLACCYQNDWKIQKSNRYLEKIHEILQKLLEQTSNKEEILNLNHQFVKLKYQQCAILSQLNQHAKALKICQTAFPLIKKNVILIIDYAKKMKSFSQNKSQYQNGVKFGEKVYSFAEDTLKSILHKIQDSSKFPANSQQTNRFLQKLQQSMPFYYWQRNPQRNQKQLRHMFLPSFKQSQPKRSILGVNKSKVKNWIQQFNIGMLMKMNFISISEWQRAPPIEEYVFKDKIQQIAILASVGYFTMATQMRFIDNGKKQQIHAGQNKSKSMSFSQEIKKKYGYQQKSTQFLLSQAHHLTSISIITDNIKQLIPYLTHLIKSYDKHYIFKKKLDQIVAIPQQSVLQGSKISHLRQRQCQRTLSRLGNSKQKSQKKSTSNVEKDNKSQYGYNFQMIMNQNQNKEKPPSQCSSDSERSQDNKNKINNLRVTHSQRKSFNHIYQTYHQLDRSARHKSTGKIKGSQKLSQTLKSKRKELTQQSFAELKKSLQQQGLKNSIKKSKKTKQKQPKQKDKQKKTAKKQKFRLTTSQGQGQLLVKHKSCTSYKFVFKKKK